MTALDELRARAGLTEEEIQVTWGKHSWTHGDTYGAVPARQAISDAARDKALFVMMEEIVKPLIYVIIEAEHDLGVYEYARYDQACGYHCRLALEAHAALQAEVDHANHG